MLAENTIGLLRVMGLFLAVVALGCAANQGCRKQAEKPPAVVLQGAQDRPVRVRVEVAASHKEREQGLMHRKHLDADAGMLFIYPFEKMQTFWMKNTYISLDLLFIADNLRIVGIVENTKPLSLEHIQVDTPSRYILEVNAGYCKKHGIREGSRVQFEGLRVGE
jgi:uncharacterized membrane protein (UPF0127 family)